MLGVFLGRRPGLKVWVGVVLALVGAYLLSVKGGEASPPGLAGHCQRGGVLLHILVWISSCGVDGVKLSCVQFLVAGLLATVLALLFESFTFSDILAAWVPLLYTGIISSGVGYTLQILGQRTVNPTVASLILSLESVFAVLAGWVLLGQPLSPGSWWAVPWCSLRWCWPSCPKRSRKYNQNDVTCWTFPGPWGKMGIGKATAACPPRERIR